MIQFALQSFTTDASLVIMTICGKLSKCSSCIVSSGGCRRASVTIPKTLYLSHPLVEGSSIGLSPAVKPNEPNYHQWMG